MTTNLAELSSEALVAEVRRRRERQTTARRLDEDMTARLEHARREFCAAEEALDATNLYATVTRYQAAQERERSAYTLHCASRHELNAAQDDVIAACAELDLRLWTVVLDLAAPQAGQPR